MPFYGVYDFTGPDAPLHSEMLPFLEKDVMKNRHEVVQELFRAASPIEHVVLGGLSSGGSGRRHTAAAVVHYRSGFGDEGAGARPRARRGVVGGRRDRWYGTRWRIVRPTAIAAL